MIDIYAGTLGTFFDRDKVEHEVLTYVTNTQESLAYEFSEDNTRLILITGKNKAEEDLPTWSHPLIIRNGRHGDMVAVDLRPYMKNKLDDMITVSEKFNDQYNGQLQLYRAVFQQAMLDRDMDWLVHARPMVTASFASIMVQLTTIMVYDQSITEKVDIMAMLHTITMDDEDRPDDINEVVERLPRRELSKLLKGNLSSFYEELNLKFEAGKLQFPSSTIGSFTNNIKAVIPGNRGNGLEPDLFIQAMSRGFFSLDSKNLSIGFVEHLPTMLAILIQVNTQSINSKSSFRKYINNLKRDTKPKELVGLLMDVYNKHLLD